MESNRKGPAFRVAVHRSLNLYIARVDGLPGCISRGATPSEAVENARAAIRNYLAVAPLLAADAIVVEIVISA